MSSIPSDRTRAKPDVPEKGTRPPSPPPSYEGGFFKGYASVWNRRDINLTEKAVVSQFQRYGYRDGRCEVSQEQIARDLDISSRSVQRAVSRLSEVGLIGIEATRKTPSNLTGKVYILRGWPPRNGGEQDKLSDSPSGGTGQIVRTTRTNCPDHPDKLSDREQDKLSALPYRSVSVKEVEDDQESSRARTHAGESPAAPSAQKKKTSLLSPSERQRPEPDGEGPPADVAALADEARQKFPESPLAGQVMARWRRARNGRDEVAVEFLKLLDESGLGRCLEALGRLEGRDKSEHHIGFFESTLKNLPTGGQKPKPSAGFTPDPRYPMVQSSARKSKAEAHTDDMLSFFEQQRQLRQSEATPGPKGPRPVSEAMPAVLANLETKQGLAADPPPPLSDQEIREQLARIEYQLGPAQIASLLERSHRAQMRILAFLRHAHKDKAIAGEVERMLRPPGPDPKPPHEITTEELLAGLPGHPESVILTADRLAREFRDHKSRRGFEKKLKAVVSGLMDPSAATEAYAAARREGTKNPGAVFMSTFKSCERELTHAQ